jgi:ABC-2 type transport system permease protein
MNAHWLKLELRLLARDRGAWVIMALFALALFYGWTNGVRVAQEQREMAIVLSKDAAAFREQVRQALAQQAIDPKAVAGRGGTAILPPAPLPLLAIGQSDLTPNYESVVLWRLNAPDEQRAEIDNPTHLLAGRFDLAFVLVWLYPLCLLALLYDLLARDRESGTLRLGLAQGVTAGRWLQQRAFARALPILILALLATLATIAFAGWGGKLRLAFAVVLVMAYGLFWVALAAAVNAVVRHAASAAASLGTLWVVIVLVAPTLLNVVVESLHPTPARPELVAAARQASTAAEQRGGDLLNSFYRDHPELAPSGLQADLAAQHLAVQEEVGRAIAPVRQKFDAQLARQQAVVHRWRFVSPAITMQEALTDLAGTGYWRYRLFRTQVDEFKQEVLAYYAPKIHRREALTVADYDRLPRFSFREEKTGAWLGRTTAGLLGLLLLAGGLGGWAGRRLRTTPGAM